MSQQCTATAKREGRRCRRFALPGMSVCWHHGSRGGDPGGTGKTSTELADERAQHRVSLARYLRQDTRPIGEIILECVGNVDSYCRSLREQVANSEVVDVEMAEKLVAASNAAATLGLHVAKLGLDARRDEIERERAALMCAAIDRAFARVPMSIRMRVELDEAFVKEMRSLTAGDWGGDPDEADSASLRAMTLRVLGYDPQRLGEPKAIESDVVDAEVVSDGE